MAVLDVGVVALFPVGFLAVGGVEDGGDVGLDGDAAGVVVGFEFFEDFSDFGLSVAGEGVGGGLGFASGGIGAVFDVDVGDVGFDLLVEF